MAERSNIEWCDSTFNPWIGCTKISPACDHCYAEAHMDTRLGRARWGAGQPRVRTSAANWRKPMGWNAERFAECGDCGYRGHVGFANGFGQWLCIQCGGIAELCRRRVFCASLADVFDNAVDREWRDDLATVILDTPNLDWLLLTKRIGNAAPMLAEMFLDGPPDNVWIGATVCDQAEADRDIPKLLRVPAAMRFLSIEPMLGPVDLNVTPPPEGSRPINCVTVADISGCLPKWQTRPMRAKLRDGIDWVIAGGESGAQARPSHSGWYRSLRDQCAAAEVPFLFKQWGEWRPICEGPLDWHDSLYRSNRVAREHENQGALDDSYGRKCTVPTAVIHADGSVHGNLEPGAWAAGATAMLTFKVGKKVGGRKLDGRTHDGYPACT